MLEGHEAPIAALAVSPDGATLASASWDRTVRLWPLAGGAPRALEGHTQNVNGVAFSPDGRTLVSVSYDLSVRIWPLSGPPAPTVVAMPSPLNAVAIGGDGEIAAGGADGRVYFLTGDGARAGEVAAGPRPVISLAISPDGALVAAAGIGGSVAVIDRKTRSLARTLVGPGLPVWSVAFLPDSRTLLTGGADNIIRRWNAVTGEPVDALLVETARRSAGRLCRRPRRGNLSRLRRLPHPRRRPGQPGGADTLRHFRPPHRHRAGLSFFRSLETPRHRLDAGDGCEIVRDRTRGLYAGHQDAGAAHRLGSRPRRAGEVSGARDEGEMTARFLPSPGG